MPRESCPSCGAAVEVPVDGWTRCPDCGFEVSSTAEAGSSEQPAREPAGEPAGGFGEDVGGDGPVGEERDPVIVVLLGLLTLNIYRLYWLWVVSKEVDGYARRSKSAHKLVKIGFVVWAVTLVVFIVAILGIVGSGAAGGPGSGPSDAMVAGFGVFMIVAFVAGLAAAILLLIGEYRIWTAIQDDEQRTGVRDPLDPVIQIVLVLVPIVNLVGMWIALYRAQDHLNDVWARARDRRGGGRPQTV